MIYILYIFKKRYIQKVQKGHPYRQIEKFIYIFILHQIMTIFDERKQRTNSLLSAIEQAREINKKVLISRASLEIGVTPKKIEEYLILLENSGFIQVFEDKIVFLGR